MEEIKQIFCQTCSDIADYIRSGSNLHNQTGQINSAGDEIKHLDFWCNEQFKKNFSKCSQIRYISSEEEATLIPTEYVNGRYLITFDPLDGSGNIDVNITIGSIFAVFRLNEDGVVESGRQIEMAGYAVYSQSLQIVIAQKDHPVCLYSPAGHSQVVEMPEKGNIYSINESNRYRWLDSGYWLLIKVFIRQEKRTTRWMGCLVADTHHTLLKGGFFAYPKDTKNLNGRIRLLYEAYPMAYIIEQAGGYSSDEQLASLLDRPFDMNNVHQKTGIVLAGKEEWKLYKEYSAVKYEELRN